MRGRNKTRPLCLLFAALLMIPCAGSVLFAQGGGVLRTPSAVESIEFGAGGGFGGNDLPENVLGLPDTSSRENIPTVSPRQVVTLGIGGEIVLRFDDVLVVDGPGPDFTVFENAFVYRTGGVSRVYAEPGQVSVSRDGQTYFAFPFDSATLEGTAGTRPTNGDRDPGDPSVSGGNAFDLALLDVDSIRFIRIRDVTGFVRDDEDHAFNDFTLNGFDLDAVVALHALPSAVVTSVASGAIDEANGIHAELIGGADRHVRVHTAREEKVSVRIFDLLGRETTLLFEGDLPAGVTRIPLDTDVFRGAYLLVVQNETGAIASTLVRM